MWYLVYTLFICDRQHNGACFVPSQEKLIRPFCQFKTKYIMKVFMYLPGDICVTGCAQNKVHNESIYALTCRYMCHRVCTCALTQWEVMLKLSLLCGVSDRSCFSNGRIVILGATVLLWCHNVIWRQNVVVTLWWRHNRDCDVIIRLWRHNHCCFTVEGTRT